MLQDQALEQLMAKLPPLDAAWSEPVQLRWLDLWDHAFNCLIPLPEPQAQPQPVALVHVLLGHVDRAMTEARHAAARNGHGDTADLPPTSGGEESPPPEPSPRTGRGSDALEVPQAAPAPAHESPMPAAATTQALPPGGEPPIGLSEAIRRVLSDASMPLFAEQIWPEAERLGATTTNRLGGLAATKVALVQMRGRSVLDDAQGRWSLMETPAPAQPPEAHTHTYAWTPESTEDARLYRCACGAETWRPYQPGQRATTAAAD